MNNPYYVGGYNNHEAAAVCDRRTSKLVATVYSHEEAHELCNLLYQALANAKTRWGHDLGDWQVTHINELCDRYTADCQNGTCGCGATIYIEHLPRGREATVVHAEAACNPQA